MQQGSKRALLVPKNDDVGDSLILLVGLSLLHSSPSVSVSLYIYRKRNKCQRCRRVPLYIHPHLLLAYKLYITHRIPRRKYELQFSKMIGTKEAWAIRTYSCTNSTSSWLVLSLTSDEDNRSSNITIIRGK
jgi:hypothetical protein